MESGKIDSVFSKSGNKDQDEVSKLHTFWHAFKTLFVIF